MQTLSNINHSPPLFPTTHIPSTSTPASVSASSEALVASSAQVSPDSLIASSVRIGERSSVKKSVIGAHCVIGRNVKISGCVIMDHVEVCDGSECSFDPSWNTALLLAILTIWFFFYDRAKLENTILSRNTVVAERTTLKDCEVAPGVSIQADGKVSSRRIVLPLSSPSAFLPSIPTIPSTLPSSPLAIELTVSTTLMESSDTLSRTNTHFLSSPPTSSPPTPHSPLPDTPKLLVPFLVRLYDSFMRFRFTLRSYGPLSRRYVYVTISVSFIFLAILANWYLLPYGA
jgi:hypothetical protein